MKKYTVLFTKYKYAFLVILLMKVCVLGLFSSQYQHEFMAFVTYFVETFKNPWDFLGKSFPYHPMMLYTNMLGVCLIKIFAIENIFLVNVLFKVPLIVADVGICYLLYKITKDRLLVLLYYFLSPIIIYSTYMHGQLDIIPTALLLLSIYFLINKKDITSFIILGFALASKTHLLATMPLVLFFLYKKAKYKEILIMLGIVGSICFFMALPYFGDAYNQFVLNNKEQETLFELGLTYGSTSLGSINKIYIAVFIFVIVYSFIFLMNKINNNLFLSLIGLIFAIFVIVVQPMPGWYVWCIPYVALFFIKVDIKVRYKSFLLTSLNILYLFYFIFLHNTHPTDKVDLYFLNESLAWLKINNDQLKNFVFSCLQGIMVVITYLLVRFGINSNSTYKRNSKSFVLGIGGDSGAGKSTLLASIYNLLGTNNVLNIEGDGDHKWERGDEMWSLYTHLDPKANYLYRQMEDIEKLKQYRAINRVDYDHASGKFTDLRLNRSKNYIVVGGLHVFYLPKMRKLIDLKIFLDTKEDLRLHWKISRDMKKRGYSKEEVLGNEAKRRDDSKKFIQPQKEYVDLVIQYFDASLTEEFIGNLNYQATISVSYTLGSNINIEKILKGLDVHKIIYEHTYSSDLRTQALIIPQPSVSFDFESSMQQMIENSDELLIDGTRWDNGLSGFNQLIIIAIIGYKMKEENK